MEKYYKLRKKKIVIFIVITTILLSSFFYQDAFCRFFNLNFQYSNYESRIKVHFIDCEQGRSVAVRFDDGKSLVIDTGGVSGKNNFLNYMSDKFITDDVKQYIDYFVITSCHVEHCANAVDFLLKYEVKNIYLPPYFKPYIENFPQEIESNIEDVDIDLVLLNTIINENAQIYYNNAGEYVKGENYSFAFLTPFNTDYEYEIDYGAIIRINYLGYRFLIAGCISQEVEQQVLNTYVHSDLRAEVYDCANLGGGNVNSSKFLECVCPKYAVIGPTMLESQLYTISKLEAVGVSSENILQNKNVGHIIFDVDSQYNINIEKIAYIFGYRLHFEWWQIVLAFEITLIGLLYYIKPLAQTTKNIFHWQKWFDDE